MSEEMNKNQESAGAGCSPTDCASCTSNCSSNLNQGNTPGIMTLTTDDGTEVDCAILTVFPVEDKEYIALLPLDKQGHNTDLETFLFAFSKTENGDPIFDNIEDDDEYKAATEAFYKILAHARKQEAEGVPIEES